MREYLIHKKPDTLDWDRIPALFIDNHLWQDPVPIKAKGQFCYDHEALYVKLTAIEENIRAENNGELGMPCQDSCLEFFFSPVDGDNRYFNIELNPNGCLFLGFGSDRYNLVRLLPQECVINPEVERFVGGWSVSYAVPFRFIQRFFPGFEAVSGGIIHANCYKCGDLTVAPHYISWNPITRTVPDFHRPDYFGLMHFE